MKLTMDTKLGKKCYHELIKEVKIDQKWKEFGVWNVEFGMWNVEFGMWNVEFGIWNVEFGVWNVVAGSGD